jgi:hypothetical protein
MTHIGGHGKTAPLRIAHTREQAFLYCGILSSLLYVAMNVFIPMLWSGYSATSQVVSELSAIDAPTRPLWVALGTIYALLYVAFGWGVWLTAAGERRLRVVGALVMAHGVFILFWPPMHLRGASFSLTDAMHIAFGVVTLLLMSITMGFGAAALGKRFRLYTAATGAVFLVFGALTGIDSPSIANNLPTPWIGVWERINIAAFMLWVVVFAEALLRRRGVAADRA